MYHHFCVLPFVYFLRVVYFRMKLIYSKAMCGSLYLVGISKQGIIGGDKEWTGSRLGQVF